MSAKLQSHLTYANVASTLALFLALTTGTAYAAATITGKDIKNESVTGADIKNGSLGGGDVKNGSVAGTDLKDESLTGSDVLDNSLGSADVSPLHGDQDIQDNTITTFDLADNSVDEDEVLDFGLTNNDVGVLYAQVNADGTVASSSGDVTAVHVGTGRFEVDFGRNISSCAFVATQGEAGSGSAAGAMMGVTDRAGNPAAAFVSVRDEAATLVDRAFQLVVVC